MDDLDKTSFLIKYGSSKHLDKIFDGSDNDSKTLAMETSTSITKEHIDKLLDDDTLHVRLFTIQHPSVTKEHLHKALDDDSWLIRNKAEGLLKEL